MDQATLQTMYWPRRCCLYSTQFKQELRIAAIRISCLLRAILASSVAPLRSSANIALNKQEIRITRYITKRVKKGHCINIVGKKMMRPTRDTYYFLGDSIALLKSNTYLLFVTMYYMSDNVLANTWSVKQPGPSFTYQQCKIRA